ncbi:MAG: NAD(P)H-quinone oxidoreductase [Sandaracinaceae bacterium]|nr:NAD(P)H-quinone oxidoreductase [Sandaracinaceae bacterium]
MSIDARAVRIREHGGPEVLEVGDIVVRDAGAGEIRVAVAAAGLNRADTLQRRGFYPAPPGVAADVPGLEFAGEVEQVGPGVTEWKLGDRVMGIVPGAGMATHVVTPAREALRVPASLSLSDAAAVPEAFLTAFDALFELGGLRQGELALIHSVASGVGTAAIQLCRAAGARSAGTSRTADKLARCQELGLDHALHSPDGRFAAELEKLAGGGADVILDTVGAAYLNENVRALALRGRLIVIGLLGGAKGEFPLGALLPKRARVEGSVLRSRAPEEKAALAQSFSKHILAGFDTGAYRPVIDATLPMADIAEAHARMDRNETFGKLVMAW